MRCHAAVKQEHYCVFLNQMAEVVEKSRFHENIGSLEFLLNSHPLPFKHKLLNLSTIQVDLDFNVNED